MQRYKISRQYDNEWQATQGDWKHQVTQNQKIKITKSQKIKKDLSVDISFWLIFQDFQMHTLLWFMSGPQCLYLFHLFAASRSKSLQPVEYPVCFPQHRWRLIQNGKNLAQILQM